MAINKNLELTQHINISASNQQVWDALTNPEKIKIYLFGTETICNWRVGSPIIFQGEYDGHKYKDKGTILKIKFEELLQYDYWSGFSGLEDSPENYSIVTYTLLKENDEIKLTVQQQGFKDQNSLKHSSKNWKQVLQQIKEISEAA